MTHAAVSRGAAQSDENRDERISDSRGLNKKIASTCSHSPLSVTVSHPSAYSSPCLSPFSSTLNFMDAGRLPVLPLSESPSAPLVHNENINDDRWFVNAGFADDDPNALPHIENSNSEDMDPLTYYDSRPCLPTHDYKDVENGLLHGLQRRRAETESAVTSLLSMPRSGKEDCSDSSWNDYKNDNLSPTRSPRRRSSRRFLLGTRRTDHSRVQNQQESVVYRSTENASSSTSSSYQSLRTSLDAGMSAVRRWIRSRTIATPMSSSSHRNDDDDDTLDDTDETDGEDDFADEEGAQMATFPRNRLRTYDGREEDLGDEDGGPRQRALSEADAVRILRGWPENEQMERRHHRRRRVRAFTEDVMSSPRLRRSRHDAGMLAQNVRAGLVSSFANVPSSNVRIPENSAATQTASTTSGGNNSSHSNSNNHHHHHRLGGPHGNMDMTSTSSMGGIPGADNPTMSNSNNNMRMSEANMVPTAASNSSTNNGSGNADDPERRARMRWIRINRRFQFVITIVALLFSLLLFGILICWVVLTSAYVVSFDKSCDVPLKPYFWLVTLQLVLDVFRSDIMRFVFHWDANSNQRIPCRVVVYNMAYLLYAMLVLRLGINSVFVQDESTCHRTAPELYNASAAFISLSMAAWATILCGYLLPFCVVAALLTYNGYNPSANGGTTGTSHPHLSAQPPVLFPAAYSNTGAPAGCIELLPVISTASADFPNSGLNSTECCICMEEFHRNDIVVETACKHVFHKQCCREWLLQARSCPVCRTDIPSHLPITGAENNDNDGTSTRQHPSSPAHNIPLGPTGRPVVGLFRMLHRPSDGGLNNSNNSNSSSSNNNRSFFRRPRTSSSSMASSGSSLVMGLQQNHPLRARSSSAVGVPAADLALSTSSSSNHHNAVSGINASNNAMSSTNGPQDMDNTTARLYGGFAS